VTAISRKPEADRLCNQARELERDAQFDAALAAYREAIALQDDHYLGHFYLSLLLVRLDRLEEARIEALRARMIHNNDAVSTEHHVSILSTLALRYAEALDVIPLLDIWRDLHRFGATEQDALIEQFVLENFTASEDSLSQVASVYFEWGRHQQVIALCSDAIEAGIATTHALHLRRAVSRIAIGELENAYRDCIAGIERDPEEVAWWDAVLTTAEQSEERCRMLMAFTALFSNEQGERPALLCGRANTLLGAQRYEQAAVAFEQLARSRGFAKSARHRLAQIAYLREDYGLAFRQRLTGIAHTLLTRLGNRLKSSTPDTAHA
jgi:tetratricopeptide (TPR) repeat protein